MDVKGPKGPDPLDPHPVSLSDSVDFSHNTPIWQCWHFRTTYNWATIGERL